MYVVAGVSGNTGRVVAETLLTLGQKTRVLVRDAAKAAAFRARGAEVAELDLANADALAAALKGAKGAYLLLPPAAPTVDTFENAERVSKAIAKAIQISGVPHVVFLSSIAAHKETGTGMIKNVHIAEKHLRQVTGTAVSYLRAPYFLDNWKQSLVGAKEKGILQTFHLVNMKFDMVHTGDIGLAAANLLLEGSRNQGVVELEGQKVSPNDVASALTNLWDRKVVVEAVPVAAMAEALQSFGMPTQTATLYQEMTASIESGHITFEGTGQIRSVRTPFEVSLAALAR
jgi:uncharacterized protein YbjT (DUF2867 family)